VLRVFPHAGQPEKPHPAGAPQHRLPLRDLRPGRPLPAQAQAPQGTVGNKNPPKKPTQKTHPKNPPKKTPLKKTTKNVFFWVFLNFFIFYENNTNFSL
jgi:hypothetical protein